MNLVDSLLLVAENNGDAYRNGKNAARAVEAARREHLRLAMDDLRAELRTAAIEAKAILRQRWEV